MGNKSAWKWYKKWYIWIVLILIVLIISLPALLSTPPGTKILLGVAEKFTEQKIQAESLSLNWFGPQKVQRLVIKDDKRHMTFYCAQAETKAPLFKISQLNASVQLHQGELKVTPPGLNPIVFDGIEMQLDAPKTGLPLHFTVTGTTEQQGVVGNFDIKGEISDLSRDHPQGNLEVTVNKLPVIGLDEIFRLEGLLVASIGSYIDLKIMATTVKNAIQVDFNANSPELIAQFAAFSENNMLRLKTPGTFSLNIHPALINRYTTLQMGQEITTLTGIINTLSCPFSEEGLDYKKLAFDAACAIGPTTIADIAISSSHAKISSAALGTKTDIAIDLNSPQFAVNTFSFSVTDQIKLISPLELVYPLPGGDKWQATVQKLTIPFPVQPEKMQMQANCKRMAWGLNADIAVDTWDSIKFSVQAKDFATQAEGKIERDIFMIKKPFTISAHLAGNAFDAFLPQVTLVKPLDVKIDMQPLSIPLKGLEMKKIQCQGKAYADSISLVAKQGGKQFLMDQPALQFSLDGRAEKADATLSFNMDAGKLQADFHVTQFLLENTSKALLSANGSIQNLTPAFIDTLFGQKLSLQTFLGNTLDLNFKVQSTPDKQTLFLKAKSPNMNLSAGFFLKDHMLQLDSSGLDLGFTLTKEAYARLDAGPFALQQPAVCTLKIQNMQWPVAPTGPVATLENRIPNITWNWDLLKLHGDFFLKEVIFQQFALNNTEVHFAKDSGLAFDAVSALAPQGKLHIKAVMPASNASQVKIDTQIKEFPTLILDLFARLFGCPELSFLPVFGKTLNADLQLDMTDNSGPLSMQITSANTRAALKGEVEHGYLTLQEPLHAQVLMTPELSALLFKEVNPFSIKEITSTSPITLEISSAGFLFPIRAFDSSKVFISKGRLEVGKISCRNEGNLSAALGLMKWSKIGRGDTLKLWFAPLEFSVKQGVVAIERTEILVADALEIAIFGRVDLPKDYVDMTLGLTPSALKAAFGIKDLPKNYLLQIPLRGPMDNVSIDTASATTKIALLLAWQQKALGGALGGGAAGSLFGGLAQKALPIPDIGAKAPPAKHPFPWEMPQKEKTGSHPIKKGDKPLKQLLKILQ